MGFAYSLSCRRACPRRTNTSVNCRFRPRGSRWPAFNRKPWCGSYPKLNRSRDERLPIYNAVVLIWIAFGGMVKISWARPKHAAFTSSDPGRLRGALGRCAWAFLSFLGWSILHRLPSAVVPCWVLTKMPKHIWQSRSMLIRTDAVWMG